MNVVSLDWSGGKSCLSAHPCGFMSSGRHGLPTGDEAMPMEHLPNSGEPLPPGPARSEPVTGNSPLAVEALARNIIRRLALATRRAPRLEAHEVSEDSMAAFCDTLIAASPAQALRFVQARRDEGVSRQGVYLGYIAPAARRLGEGWENDELSFVDVTIATGHLYVLMRALRTDVAQVRPMGDALRCALFATVPNEQHSIGITMAAHLFRDAGWDIDLQIGTTHDGLVEHVAQTRPPIIGLSLSTEERVQDLSQLVGTLRAVVPDAVIGVAPAGGLDCGQISRFVDLDLVFRDVPSACTELDRLIRLRDWPRMSV
jgi:MerR family transcriptional regulator, light-induced transcriptional regulator